MLRALPAHLYKDGTACGTSARAPCETAPGRGCRWTFVSRCSAADSGSCVYCSACSAPLQAPRAGHTHRNCLQRGNCEVRCLAWSLSWARLWCGKDLNAANSVACTAGNVPPCGPEAPKRHSQQPAPLCGARGGGVAECPTAQSKLRGVERTRKGVRPDCEDLADDSALVLRVQCCVRSAYSRSLRSGRFLQFSPRSGSTSLLQAQPDARRTRTSSRCDCSRPAPGAPPSVALPRRPHCACCAPRRRALAAPGRAQAGRPTAA